MHAQLRNIISIHFAPEIIINSIVLLAKHIACNIDYWHHDVVCPSVCDTVAKWYILKQSCFDKWIGSAFLGKRWHSFQPPTQTPHPQNLMWRMQVTYLLLLMRMICCCYCWMAEVLYHSLKMNTEWSASSATVVLINKHYFVSNAQALRESSDTFFEQTAQQCQQHTWHIPTLWNGDSLSQWHHSICKITTRTHYFM